jgi:hypothetical protein
MQRSAPVHVEILGIKNERDNPQIASKSTVFVAFISGLCTMCVAGAQPFTTCRKVWGRCFFAHIYPCCVAPCTITNAVYLTRNVRLLSAPWNWSLGCVGNTCNRQY